MGLKQRVCSEQGHEGMEIGCIQEIGKVHGKLRREGSGLLCILLSMFELGLGSAFTKESS